LILNRSNGLNLSYGGHSAVLLNGQPGTYFECQKGVRQNDPLSPYLFLLDVEGLNKILSKGIASGHFEGLSLPVIDNRKVLNLQYADDMLLFLKADYMIVERVKWDLCAFEGISSLKINFNKSELIALNIDSAVARNFAIQLHCKLGTLPLKYLCLSLHWKQPFCNYWLTLID
jgi:Reverse transcriptase (RNA-dependent DNA polymerase)